MENLKKAIRSYSANKTWYYYMPLWLACLYVFYLIIQFSPGNASPLLAPIGAFMFGLHEFGHAVTMWSPSILTAAAGSGSEILIGLVLVFAAIKTRYYFTTLVCSLWLAYGFKSAGLYMADARTQKLELVSPFGDNAVHDWHFVFGKLHLLQYDTLIGGVIKFTGYLITTLVFAFCAWLIYKFAEGGEEADEQEDEQAINANGHELYPTPTKGQLAPRDGEEPEDTVYNSTKEP